MSLWAVYLSHIKHTLLWLHSGDTLHIAHIHPLSRYYSIEHATLTLNSCLLMHMHHVPKGWVYSMLLKLWNGPTDTTGWQWNDMRTMIVKSHTCILLHNRAHPPPGQPCTLTIVA